MRYYCIFFFVGRVGLVFITISRGTSEIYLSETLLRPRGSEDVKNVILHEMIHAYMWVKSGLKNRRYRLIYLGCHFACVF